MDDPDGASGDRAVESDGDRRRNVPDHQLSVPAMTPHQGATMGIDSPEAGSNLRSGEWSLHRSDGRVFEVDEISIRVQKFEHLLEDAADQRRIEVVEWKPADDVIVGTVQVRGFNGTLMQPDRNVGALGTKRGEKPFLDLFAEGRIDLDDVESISGAQFVEDAAGEGPGAGADLEYPSSPVALPDRPGHLPGEKTTTRAQGSGISKVQNRLGDETNHG